MTALSNRIKKAADDAEREAWHQTNQARRDYCEGTAHGLRTALRWLTEAAASPEEAPPVSKLPEVATPVEDAADGLLTYLPPHHEFPLRVDVYRKGRNGRSDEAIWTLTYMVTNKIGDEVVLVDGAGNQYRFSLLHGGEVTRGRSKQETRFVREEDLPALRKASAR